MGLGYVSIQLPSTEIFYLSRHSYQCGENPSQLMHGKLERLGQAMIVVYFMAVIQYLPSMTKEQNTRISARKLLRFQTLNFLIISMLVWS
jgi:hypothetical protein